MSDGAMFFIQGNSDYFHDPRRIAIENELVSRRDMNASILGRGNGAVIRSKEGAPSDVIRMGMEDVLRVADKNDPVRKAVAEAITAIEDEKPMKALSILRLANPA